MSVGEFTNIEGKDTQYMMLEYICYVFGLWDYPASHLIADNIKIIEMKQLTYADGKNRNILITYMVEGSEPTVAIYKLQKNPDEKKKAWVKVGSMHLGIKSASECDTMLKNATVLFGKPKDE